MEAGRALWLAALLVPAVLGVGVMADDGQPAGGAPDTNVLCVSKCGTCPTVCTSPPPPPLENPLPLSPKGGGGGYSSPSPPSRASPPPKGGWSSNYYYFFTAASSRRAAPGVHALLLPSVFLSLAAVLQ